MRLLEKQNPVLTNALLCVLMAALTFFAFSPILDNGFILFDDPGYVTENPHVLAGLSPDSVKWAFETTLTGNWIPVAWLSHLLDVTLYGVDPAGHHLTSLVFHIASVMLVFAFLQITTKQPMVSALAAVLFAVHPLRVESVAWVSERKDVLSAFFGVGALISYVFYTRRSDGSRWFFYVLTFLLLTLGLMSKAMLVTWPFLFLVLDFWPLKRRRRDTNVGRLLLEKIPFVLLVIAFSAIAFYAQRVEGAVHTLQDTSMHLRLANALASYGRYLYKFIWPAELPLLYPLNIRLLAPVNLILTALMMVGLTVLFFLLRRKKPWLLTGWLWFVGTLVPVIGLVQIGNQSIANRYMYIPSIGLSIIAAFTAGRIAASSKGLHIACTIFFAGITAAMVFWTLVQCMIWKNSLRVFSYSLEVTGPNYVMQFDLANALLKDRRYEEAIAAFEKAHLLSPKSSEPIGMLGEAAVKQGRYEQAIEYLHQAIEMNVDLDEETIYNNLGIAYAKTGRPETAAEWFEKSLALAPDNPEILSNAASAFRDSGRYEKAVAALRKALRLRPDFPADMRKLADILLVKNSPVYNPRAALELAQGACELSENKKPDYLITLAEAHLALNQIPQARAALDAAARNLSPEKSETRSRLEAAQAVLNEKSNH